MPKGYNSIVGGVIAGNRIYPAGYCNMNGNRIIK